MIRQMFRAPGSTLLPPLLTSVPAPALLAPVLLALPLLAAVLALATLITPLAPAPARAETPLSVRELAPGTYALEGPFGQRSPENLGNNATFGLVVTDAGAVLIDAGGSWQGGRALDAAIRTVTDQPVTLVINTGGQDHRWLGNGYWKSKGARVIASADAVADQKSRASMQLSLLSNLLGDALAGTEPAYADTTFDDAATLRIGNRTLRIVHPGPAHTPGDSFVVLPDTRTVFAGDIVFTGRLLGVLDVSSSAGWIAAFDAMAATDPAIVVPGHGPAGPLATARHDTRDYLANLRAKMRAHIDEGGDILTSVEVDQSAFSTLTDFALLARRNAQAVFSEMEWE